MTNEELVERYLAGLPVEGHCYPQRLYAALRRAGHEPNRKGRPSPKVAEALALRAQGLTYAEVGARVGVTGDTVRKWAIRWGGVTPPVGRGKWSRAAQRTA